MQEQRNYWQWAGIALLLASMLAGLLWLQQDEVNTYRAEGVPANAIVTGKSETQNIANDTTTYVLSVTYMNEEDTARSGVTGSLQEGDLDLGEIDVGEFQRARVEVRSGSYHEIEVGDRVPIRTIPGEPDRGMLAAEVENYFPGIQGGLLVLLLLAALVLALLGLIQRLRVGRGQALQAEAK